MMHIVHRRNVLVYCDVIFLPYRPPLCESHHRSDGGLCGLLDSSREREKGETVYSCYNLSAIRNCE